MYSKWLKITQKITQYIHTEKNCFFSFNNANNNLRPAMEILYPHWKLIAFQTADFDFSSSRPISALVGRTADTALSGKNRIAVNAQHFVIWLKLMSFGNITNYSRTVSIINYSEALDAAHCWSAVVNFVKLYANNAQKMM